MERATRESWQTTPMPEQRERLGFLQRLSPYEAEKLGRGCIPGSMEQKWFVFQEGDWVYFHRSWTGICVFSLRLAPEPDGAVVAEAWVNRDSAQIGGSGAGLDEGMLRGLLHSVIWERR